MPQRKEQEKEADKKDVHSEVASVDNEMAQGGSERPQAEVILPEGASIEGGHKFPAAIVSRQMYSGPVPHPDILRGYEQVLPGSADRILKLAEDEATHRRKMEEKALTSSCTDSRTGLWLGFIIVVVALVVSYGMVSSGYPSVGGVVGVGSLAGLAGTFVYGSRQTQAESRRREQHEPHKNESEKADQDK